MLKRTFFTVLFTLLVCSAASALTLEDVIYLSSAGVDDSIIIAKMEASGAFYDLSSREIVELWEAGVRGEVIEYMISTSSGSYGDEEEYHYEYEYDDDGDEIVVVRHPRSTVHLYFGFGYYDGWYYPYWSWHRPYYYGYYSYSWRHWPYYYYWSPYAYYYPWDCWSYRHGRHIVANHGLRHHWRRSGGRDGRDYGRSGYRLKPRYSFAKGKKGGYLARDGRYVFPRDKKGREYTGSGGYRKPLAYGERTGRTYGDRKYGDVRGYRTRDGRTRYSKPRSGDPRGSGASKATRYQARTPVRDGTPKRVYKSRSGTSGSPKRSQVGSSRSRSGGSRSSVGRSRSSGSSGSARGSSGRGSSRGGRRR
jgi:hypothetical protein